jgi:type IV pilus assembly protein PilB
MEFTRSLNKKENGQLEEEKREPSIKTKVEFGKKKMLGELLVDAGVITKEQLQIALEEQGRRNEKLGKVLVDLGFVSEDIVVSYLSKLLGIPCVNLDKLEVPQEVINMVPEFMVHKYLIFPIAKKDNVLTIAMADPLNLTAIGDVRILTGCEIQTVIARESEIREAIVSHYRETLVKKDFGSEAETKQVEIVRDEEEAEEDISKALAESREAPVINMVNHILVEAIRAGTSDIHLEIYNKRVRVRYRIDGILYEVNPPPKDLYNAIVSRIKVMAKLDIADRRQPQDGRCRVRLENKDIDLRISVVPTSEGEKVAVRILDPSGLCLDLTKLGFDSDTLALYEKKISAPYGMILITGPTGSGKTTTLYSTLRSINTPSKHIITIEDPVEYNIPGINQVQVKPEIGFNFAQGIRSFVRQDPDIIMVGEIRDKETAEMAINAALTGHLVFSTMHTNDAAGTIARLIDMGIEPFLIISTVLISVAQRLIRKLCEKCKEPYEVSASSLKKIGIDVNSPKVTLYRPKGCPYCAHIGYRGRIGVFEIMSMSDNLRELVMKSSPVKVLKEAAIKEGMISLRLSAIRKVLSGITTMEEMLRVTVEEEHF